MKLGTATLSTIAAASMAVALLTGTAGAEPGNGQANGHDNAHAQAVGRDHDGDADSSSDTSHTEDTDTNDGGTANNVADDGDDQHPSGRDRSVEHGGSGNQGRSESAPDQDGHGPERDHGGTDKPDGPGGEDLADQDGNNGCGNDDDFEDDNEGWCGRTKPEQTTTTTAAPAAPAGAAGNQGRGGDHASPSATPHADDDDDTDADVAAATYPAPIATAFGGGSSYLPAVIPDRVDALVLPAAGAAATDDGAVLGLQLENTPAPRRVFATSAGGAVGAELASASEPASTTGVAAAAAGALAFTGDHLFVVMAIAVVALAVGAALVTRARRFEA